MQLTYNEMVLESDRVPSTVNIIAALCSWWIMAGFLVLPGAFVSLEKSKILQAQPDLTQHIHVVLPLLGALSFVSGACGICYLWKRFRHNYVWLSSRLIIPTLASTTNCLYIVLVNIYTAQDGFWSWPAYFAVTSVALTMVSMISALGFYHYQLGLMVSENTV
ncbi:hypothetical protein BR93DRAFT_392897 [Coniochaeta sp. PMI_546]|nr:hypothetical protein BR93DRAFT_392897 [Coniochaeta sp. PMI_546]